MGRVRLGEQRKKPEERASGLFLWAPDSNVDSSLNGDFPSNGLGVSLPEFLFSSGVAFELDSIFALGFSNVEMDRSSSVDAFNSPLDGKSVVLSCTQSQGTHIIDAAVKNAARKLGADVLVLDALELASGRFGTLGPLGHAIDKLHPAIPHYYEAADTGKPTLDEDTVRFIDALLTIPPILSNEPAEDVVEAEPSRRRIVYMRDFQFISYTAKPLMTYILHSLYLSYGTNYPPDPYGLRRPPRHTSTPLLVFGINGNDEPLVIDGNPQVTQMDCPFLSSLFTHARSAIAKQGVTTWLSAACCQWPSGPFPPVEPPRVPFITSLGEKVDELASGALSMPLYAANVRAGSSDEDWQRAVKAKLFGTVNHVMLRACMERDMCPLYEDVTPLDIMPSTSILEMRDATRVVSAAMGAIAAAVHSKEPLQPPTSYVKKAYEVYERRKQEQTEWERGFDATVSRASSNGDGVPNFGMEINEPLRSKESNLLDGLSEYAEGLKGCIVDISSIPTTFSDVFVDPATIESLQTIVSLPLLFPSYFNSGVLAQEAIGGVLLYGPPGTGKTMLCRALAKSNHARMLHIKPSDIINKWAGESEKSVAAVFELAYKLSPCIVFIDEIDALFSSRNDETMTWERNILTEFMQNMDGLRSAKKNRDSNVVVVGATNRPFDLDLAILRRMPRRILVDLPTFEMRKGILGSYLQNEVLDDEVSIEKLALDTEGFSGSDLKNLCVAAALASVKQTIGPQWKDRVALPPTKPSTAKDGKGVKDGKAGKEDLPIRKITTANIRQAQFEIGKSIAGNRGDKLYGWHKTHATTEPIGTSASNGSTFASTMAARTWLPALFLIANWWLLPRGFFTPRLLRP